MAIQVRRGNEADFDASKMLPGEWAVSLDTRYVRMCFAPGLVLRMSTYESFEADMAQIQAILTECRSIQSAVQRIQAEVNAKASLTIEYSNSAKESADRAYSEAERAKTYANNAEAVTGVQIATMDRAGLVKGGDNYIAEDGTLTLIKETTAFTMPNSYDGRLLVEEIGGVTEQNTTAGSQLFDVSTCTYGNINASGVPTENMTNMISDYIRSNGEIYVATNANVAGIGIAFYDANKNYLNRLVATSTNHSVSQKVDGCEYVRVWFGVDSNDLTIERLATYEPMVNKGTTALPWEPYTGGIPSPNPSYPQEIKKTVVSEIKTHGKNLIDFRKGRTITGGGVTYTVQSDGSYKRTGTATDVVGNVWLLGYYGITPSEDTRLVHLEAGKNYYVKDCILFFGTSGFFGGIVDATEYPNGIDITAVRNIEFEVGKTYDDVVYPMVCEAEYGADWEPYTESSITFSQPIELYGIGDVQDVIEDGKVKRKFVENVLPKDAWTLERIDETNSYIEVRHSFQNTGYVDSPTNYLLCTHVGREGGNRLILAYNALYMRFPLTAISTFEEATDFLANNDVKYLIEYKTPTTEELPIADQIALNSLSTFDGITYLEFDSEIKPTFKSKYGTSEVGGYTLEGMLAGRNGELMGKDYANRITALEATVVNNI